MMLYYYGEVIRHVREEDNDEDYDYDYYDYDYDYYDNDDDDYRLSVFNIPVEDYEGNDLEVPTYVSLQFAGAVIAIVSWVSIMSTYELYVESSSCWHPAMFLPHISHTQTHTRTCTRTHVICRLLYWSSGTSMMAWQLSRKTFPMNPPVRFTPS